MAQQEKGLPQKPGDLGSIPGTQVKMEEENWPYKVVYLTSTYALWHVHMRTHTDAHTINQLVKCLKELEFYSCKSSTEQIVLKE